MQLNFACPDAELLSFQVRADRLCKDLGRVKNRGSSNGLDRQHHDF